MPPRPPSFAQSWTLRLEHAALALALLVALAYLVIVREATDAWRVGLWLVLPDVTLAVAALLRWSPVGIVTYNTGHHHATWIGVFTVASLLQGHAVWPLLAWGAHIEIDRALGFHLRSTTPP